MNYSTLTITRKTSERILIGPDIVIEVARIKGDRVSLRIRAPEAMPILRDELALKVGQAAGIAWIPSDRSLLPLRHCPVLMRLIGDIVIRERELQPDGESP